MNKVSILLRIISWLLIIIAIVFIGYALNHPEGSFIFDPTLMYIGYVLVFAIVNIGRFVLYKKNKERSPKK